MGGASRLKLKNFGRLMIVATVAAVAAAALPVPVAAAPRAPTPHPRVHRVIRHQAQRLAPAVSTRQIAQNAPAPNVATGTWTSLGPQPISNLDTYGATSGRITALAANGSIVYAGTGDGGVWRSTDSGANWTAISDGQATLAIGALAVDWTTSPETVYAATGEANHCQDCLPSQGVLKGTLVAGAWTWTLLAQPTFTAQRFVFYRLTVDHSNAVAAPRLLGATNRGLYLSTDGGTTWSVVLAGETTDVVQDPTTSTSYWAAQADGDCLTTSTTNPLYGSVAVSADSGATWTTKQIFAGLPEAIRISLGVGTSGTAYAAVAACQTNGPTPYTLGQLAAIEKTTNGGSNWTALTPGSPATLTDYMSSGSTPPIIYQGWYDNTVAVDPTNSAHAVFGGISMLVTQDGGSSFAEVAFPYNGGPLHPDFHAVAFTAASTFYVGNDGGVYRTTDFGGSGQSSDWTNDNATLSITQFYQGSAPDLNHVVGGAQDEGTSAILPGGPPAPAWQSLLDGDGGWTAQVPNSPTVYAEASGLDMFQVDTSTGVATEIGPCASPFTDPSCSDSVAFIAPFVRDPMSGNGVERLYAGTYRVYRTTTGGLPAGGTGSGGAWTLVSPDLTAGTISTPSGPQTDDLHTMAIGSGATSGTLLTGSKFGRVWMTTTAPTATTSSGWVNITGNLPAFSLSSYNGNAWISALALNPANHAEAWVAIGTSSGGRIWHTTNAGSTPTTWSDITGTMPNVVVASLALDPLNASVLYAGTDTGPQWCSTCGGATPTPNWSALGTGIPNARVDALTITNDASTIIAWTHGRGAWSIARPLPTPVAKLNPTSLTFGSERVGITSPPQAVTLTNTGTANLTVSSVVSTGDFHETDNCVGTLPPSPAPGSSCTINVTFTPSGLGTRNGTVQVNDNAADSPQVVTLSGNGIGNWSTLGGIIISGPGASTWGVSREDVFVQGQDRALWHQSFNGSSWSGWQSLGGIVTSDPGAVSWGTNRIDVFIRGQDRQLWHQSSSDGVNWSGWEPLGGILNSGPDVASPAPGRLDVFIQGQDNQLWQKTFTTGGGWGGWQPLGGIITAAPGAASASSGQIDVVARGQDNQLWVQSFNGTNWSGWQPLGGILASAPDASSWGGGRLDVFIEGQDRQLWHRFRSGGAWSGWIPLGGIITDVPGAASPAVGTIDVFVRGQDAALWQYGFAG